MSINQSDSMASFSRKRRSIMKRSSGDRATSNHAERPKSRPSLSSMLLSLSLSNSPKKNAFRGLGCASAPDVHNPSSAHSLVRSSADWNAKKSRQKPARTSSEGGRKKKTQVVDSDVWCSPGIPFSTDADSVDCVVYRRPAEPMAPKRISRHQRSVASDFTFDVASKSRERPSIERPNSVLEQISEVDSLPAFETLSPISYRYLRGLHHISGDLTELVMLQTSLIFGRIDLCDRFREWRLDVDNMTYEELLELGDKIGYVSTGLKEDGIACCVRKLKYSASFASHLSSEREKKCSICQEEYEGKDEVGRLNCGHYFHICCIKQWLLQKNACPVCKLAASDH
ncbi:uncharacterized protein LOC116264914 isoform X2 [Nymphaea colorata]|uniref:uncharacterized protein LOC116264914 isoform X2 n=1 Tax=Nymphaea colorata TaxID=210225 RepID=UPI00129D7FD0|nr:uncharacterized protein LOC116264914 isoform X2 [Nymphaea colorata]